MKIIVNLLILLLVTGCVSTTAGLDNTSDSSPQTKFYSSMSAGDQTKLIELINTTRPDEVTTLSGDENYEFTSFKIFINAQGQACREYKIKALYGFRKESQQVACRNDEGIWHVK